MSKRYQIKIALQLNKNRSGCILLRRSAHAPMMAAASIDKIMAVV